MARFLRFAVEHALCGRADDLKEYVIGVEVFDRSAEYDPRVDPIVRVEARRLRSKLKAYYEGEGSGDSVVIEFLSGSYAPSDGRRLLALFGEEPAKMRGTASIRRACGRDEANLGAAGVSQMRTGSSACGGGLFWPKPRYRL